MPGPIIAEWTGVWPDASIAQAIHATVPDLEIPQGTDGVITLAVKNPDGSAKDITAGLLVLAARVTPGKGAPLLARRGVVTDGPAGLATFDIGAADTNFSPVEARCSVEITLAGLREQIVPLGRYAITGTGSLDGDVPDDYVDIGVGLLPGVVYLKITQAMLDANVSVAVPLDFVPTAAVGAVMGGANVSDLISVDGIHPQVLVAMNDGDNPSPYLAGSVIVITAV